ncbi:hypothetical protein WISP_17553 [Willisornis vidua]|uniref:Uncharacterized protein n=1 Tax=Willisornis vidua TaxID=1566151 RepID=A0ABQ9DTV3_9PASS|nr:hypothetical protein WISP_17553 [Willisornis vidua]
MAVLVVTLQVSKANPEGEDDDDDPFQRRTWHRFPRRGSEGGAGWSHPTLPKLLMSHRLQGQALETFPKVFPVVGMVLSSTIHGFPHPEQGSALVHVDLPSILAPNPPKGWQGEHPNHQFSKEFQQLPKVNLGFQQPSCAWNQKLLILQLLVEPPNCSRRE